jgi:putative peptide zinc metalloprotease protein
MTETASPAIPSPAAQPLRRLGPTSDSAREVGKRPVLGPEVRLVGRMEGAGFRDDQWLVERDGKFVQLSELLFRVAELTDGRRTLEQIAEGLTTTTRWAVTGDHVRLLIDQKLSPLRIVRLPDPDGTETPALREPGRSTSVGIRGKRKVIGPRVIEPVTAVLRHLYRPAAMTLVILTIVVAHGWFYVIDGALAGVSEAFATPSSFFVALVILVVSGVVHEFGHASALRYGGGRARSMGVGLYLIFPSFYTDVTEGYRLGRWSRVRTDLGGIYFHLLFCSALIGVYSVAPTEFLLLAVALVDLEIVRQLLPIGRLDGYWLLADLTGIPDPLSQMVPFVRSLVPVRTDVTRGERLPRLRPWTKAAFIVFLGLTAVGLPLIIVALVAMLPSIIEGAWRSALEHTGALTEAVERRDVLASLGATVLTLLSGLQVFAVAYLIHLLGVRPVVSMRARSESFPRHVRRRMIAALVTAMGGTILAVGAFWPWRSVQVAGLSASSSNGYSHGLGILALACGLAAVIGGLATLLAWTDRLRRLAGIAAIVLAVTGLAAASVFVWRSQSAVEDTLRRAIEQRSGQAPSEEEVATITEQLERLGVSAGPRYGVFLAGVGSVFALCGGIMTTRIRRPQGSALPVAART